MSLPAVNPVTGEEWRPVRGYPGRYEASSHGRVRSLPRITSAGRRIKGRTLSSGIGHAGHPIVALAYDGVTRSFQVNRLVADAFLKRPPAYLIAPQIRHRDGDLTNCRAENLQWVPNGYVAGQLLSAYRRGETAQGRSDAGRAGV